MYKVKIKWIGVLFIIVTIILLFVRFGGQNFSDNDDKTTQQRHRYALTVINESQQAVEDISIDVFLPADFSSIQSLESVDINFPYTISTDSFGNNTARIQIDRVGPFSKENIVIKSTVSIGGTIVLDNSSNFLVDEKLTHIKSIRPIVKDKDFTISAFANEISGWVYDFIEDKQYILPNKGAQYALDSQKGDCTEHMYLASALFRQEGIPTINVAGFLVEQDNSILSHNNYHNWNYVLDEDAEFGYFLVDSFVNKVQNNSEGYLIFRVLDEQVTTLSNTQRFLVHDQRVKITEFGI